MAVFGYGRVSTAEQTADNQRHEIERAGYAVEYWFADTVSGKAHAAQRKQFSILLGKLRGRDTLVVSKLDRLGRDAPNVLATIKDMAALGVEVVVLQLGKLDVTSPAGKLMLAMLAAVAEMERDLIVERTQAGLVRAKSEGKILGRKPKTSPEQRVLIVEGYKEKESISALARRFGVSRSTVLTIVSPRAKPTFHAPSLRDLAGCSEVGTLFDTDDPRRLEDCHRYEIYNAD
jgi:putative DNA-invertase from lambdoid prophage Rac